MIASRSCSMFKVSTSWYDNGLMPALILVGKPLPDGWCSCSIWDKDSGSRSWKRTHVYRWIGGARSRFSDLVALERFEARLLTSRNRPRPGYQRGNEALCPGVDQTKIAPGEKESRSGDRKAYFLYYE